jgi:hypothetical protein
MAVDPVDWTVEVSVVPTEDETGEEGDEDDGD